MKHVFIIGSRGYHAEYGGWETFVSSLVDNYNDKNTIFHISMITDDKHLNEYKVNDNIIINPIFVGISSSIKMFLYTIRAYKFYLKYVESENIEKSYFYILGLKLFNYLGITKSKTKKLGIKVFVNPDGLEWKRSKWPFLIKKFFLVSEMLMLKNSDIIVCDSRGIEEYIQKKYPKLKDRTVYIAYGFENFNFDNIDEKKILDEYRIKKDEYLLMVGRCVPENNYELILNDFINSSIQKKLVIVSNLSSTDYYNYLLDIVKNDKRVIFIDGIYNKEKLAVVRKNAFAYIHGHSVGGTNPSLIEALSLTDLNILYDVCFNSYVGCDACLYFKEKGSLTKLLDDVDFLKKSKAKLGTKAKKIVNDNFTWKIIVNKYKEIFK